MKKFDKYLYAFLYSWIIKFSTFLKISYLVGSQAIFLSASSFVTPLSGAFGGIFGASIIFFIRIFTHLLLFKTISLSFLSLCIPGFCASLYWATKNSIIRLFLPIICILLFIAHPVGHHVALYAAYWLIPVIIYFMSHQSLFLTALGSTFTAHAVGSIIWLYTTPMTPTMIMSLIPIVACERLLFATGMVVFYKLISRYKNIYILSAQKTNNYLATKFVS